MPTATHTPTPEPTHTATPMPAATFTPTPTAVPIPVVVSGITPEAPDDGCDCFWLGVLGGVLLGALTLLIAYVLKRRRELQSGVRPQDQIETNDLNQ